MGGKNKTGADQRSTGQPTPGDQFELSGDFRYATIYIKSAIVDSAEAKNIEDLPPEPGDPPFQGLQYFSEEDASRFFGREVLTARLVARQIQERFLAVVGASGSGKSSLVRGGVIPGLRRGQRLAEGVLPPKDSPKWAILTMTPGAHPLEALAVALSAPDEPLSSIENLRNELKKTPANLSLAIRKYLAHQKLPHMLLFVDQFEEVFTLCRHLDEREAFFSGLLEATNDQNRIPLTVLVALRADFYADIAHYDQLRKVVSEHQEFIGAMSREELVRVIDRPLALGDWKIQEGLIEVILNDIGYEPGSLPLLSHALHETWLRRRGRTLILAGYTETGGVRGAVAQTAESVYRGLAPPQQAVARKIFLRMAEIGEDSQITRRRVPFRDLISRTTDELVLDDVISILAEARLVTTGIIQVQKEEHDGSGSNRVVDVAHEALIREWPTLHAWLEEDREGLILHQELTEAANDWRDRSRDPGELYRSARLEETIDWAEANFDKLSLLEEEFLEASRQMAKKEADQARNIAQAARQQRVLAGLAAILLISVAYLVYTFLIYRTPAVMDGFYNIAVADFSTGDTNNSNDIDKLISDELKEELGNDSNLLIWHDGPELRELNVTIGSVDGETAAARIQNASETAERLQADMLIYGANKPTQSEQSSEDMTQITLEFYLAPRLDYNYEDLQGVFQLDCSILLEHTEMTDPAKNALARCARSLAWIAFGLTEAQLGHSLEALEAFLNAEQFNPSSELIKFLLGREYLFLIDREVVLEFVREDFEQKAEQSFINAIELNPDYPRAYIGLGSVYTKRARRIVSETSTEVSIPPEAVQHVQQAIDLYSQAYELSESSTEFGIPLDNVARLALGNIYILKGQILYFQGNNPEALQQFDLANKNLEQTVGPFKSAGQARYLTQAYEYLGSAFEWKAYINILNQNYDLGKQNYKRALNYFDQCIELAESSQDLIIKNEIANKICLPKWESVKNNLGSLEGTGESSE